MGGKWLKRRSGGRGRRNSHTRKIDVRKVETEEERKIMVETETDEKNGKGEGWRRDLEGGRWKGEEEE